MAAVIDMARARDAGLLRRLMSVALDLSMLLAVLVVGTVMARHAAGAEAMAELGDLASAMVLTLAACASVMVLAAWRWAGGTPGTRLMGMVLVRARDGRPGGLARLLVRFFTALATGGLGVLWARGGRSALYDRASGMRLIIEDELLAEPLA